MTGILSLKESLPIHLHHQIHTEIRKYLSEFCKKYDAMLLPTKDSHYFIIGTSKLIKVIKENYRAFPLMDDVEKNCRKPDCAGIRARSEPSFFSKTCLSGLRSLSKRQRQYQLSD